MALLFSSLARASRCVSVARHVRRPSYRAFATAAYRTGQNLVEKIVQKYAVDQNLQYNVKSGDFIMMQPEHVMTHDNTAAVMSK
jgi:homoaconitate hydratase